MPTPMNQEIAEILRMTFSWIGKKYAACPASVTVAGLKAQYPAIQRGEAAIDTAAMAQDLLQVKAQCRVWCKIWSDILDRAIT